MSPTAAKVGEFATCCGDLDEAASVPCELSAPSASPVFSTWGESALRPLGVVRPLSTGSERSYLRQIADLPLLSAIEEVALARRIERGDATARRQLIEANLRLVVFLARRHSDRGLPLADLVQEGSIGLMRAVDKFDHRRGLRFSTYAHWWIRQALLRALADQGRTIRLPLEAVSELATLDVTQRKLQRELGREPSPEEIAHAVGSPAKRVRELLGCPRETLSLEATFAWHEGWECGEPLADDDAFHPLALVAKAARKQALAALLRTLPRRERMIILLRYGLSDDVPRTYREIGRVLGVSHEHVRQLAAKAMAALEAPDNLEHLRALWD